MTTPSDIKALWRDQPQEGAPMRLEDIRRKASAFQSRKRWINAVEYAASALVIVAFGFYVRFLPGVSLKLASILTIAWALFYIWQRHRLMAARPLPEDAAACLDFHRSELERQRDAVRGGWRWMLAPILPVIVLIILGRLIELPAIGRAPWLDHAFIVLGAVLMLETLGMLWLWLENRADALQDKIDALDGETP